MTNRCSTKAADARLQLVRIALLNAASAHGTNDMTWIAAEDADALARAALEVADTRQDRGASLEFIDRLVTHALGCGAFDDDPSLWREAAAITGRDPDSGNRVVPASEITPENTK